MSKNEVKINGKIVPCENIQRIELVCVSDKLYREITYYEHEPVFHVVKVLVDADKGYEIEKKVRKAMLKY